MDTKSTYSSILWTSLYSLADFGRIFSLLASALVIYYAVNVDNVDYVKELVTLVIYHILFFSIICFCIACVCGLIAMSRI